MHLMPWMPLSDTSCSIHIGIPASVAVPKREEKRNEEIYGDVSLTYPANAVVSEWGQSSVRQIQESKRGRKEEEEEEANYRK